MDMPKNENECNEIIIDITNVKEPAQWRPECCIYKVPKRLREVKKEAYAPKLISIGPVHRHNKELNLEEMEMLKLKYFKEFFDRTSKVQKDFANIVEENKGKIRHCYEASIKMPDDKAFKEMILLDSIFIIELFLRTATREEDEKDYILSKPWLEDGIKQDLILLENQLPFFIFDELYRHFARSTIGITKCFLTLAWNYFFPDDKKITIEKERMRTCLVVPRFVVDYKTEDLFRNLMALEQCHYPSHAYICNYILLLDFLINTKEDVELLVEKKILVNWLGSNEAVATMVNKLGQEIVEKNSCYHEIATKLNGHYDNCWNHNMASLKDSIFP
uniref:Uncharacterized protein n=1 Tax=Fagus sylvatica TaxID=28930 RepID=A0A2N9H9K3_FAGSY